jgi:hypothetical protein
LKIESDPDKPINIIGSVISNTIYTYSILENEIQIEYLPFTDPKEYDASAYGKKISPNRERLVYILTYQELTSKEWINRQIMLLDLNHPVKILSGYNPNDQLIGWLNNEWLIFNPTVPYQHFISLWNPSNGGTKRLTTDLPELYYEPATSLWFGSNNPVPKYDPSGALAVYIRGSGEMQYALWDIKSQILLWSRDVWNISEEPQWSSNGEYFALAVPPIDAGTSEIYIIDRNGEETQITNFNSYFSGLYVGPISWSPDNRYIAFWITYINPGDIEWEIAIVNVETGEITDYCITGYEVTPIWSPDSRQIAIAYHNQDETYEGIAILDIFDEKAFLLAEDVRPAGWIK